MFLSDLKPSTEYQVGLYLIPVPKAKIELTSGTVIKFKTSDPPKDPFDFKIKLQADHVDALSMDLSWTGIPSPYQKFINLYRILYLEEDMPGMDPHSAFIVSNIDVLSSSRIGHLQPQKAYQVWLEGFLRNGKVVKSNVLSITTKTASSNLPGMSISRFFCTPIFSILPFQRF